MSDRALAMFDKLPAFPFDSPKLERVISNLLENSFKFVPQGGTVWLHAEPYMWERRSASQPASGNERRRLDNPQPNSVKVSVSDTGPGIPADKREVVLGRRVRLDEARNVPGSGLGLSLVAAVTKLHGARLTLDDAAPGLRVSLQF